MSLFLCTLLSVLSIISGQDPTCASAGLGPCFAVAPGFYACQTGGACLVDATNDANSICCAFDELVYPTTTAAPTTAATTAATTVESTIGEQMTTEASCVDLINPNTGTSDCPNRVSLCDNAVYYSLMTEQCPKTCNRCNEGSDSIATTASSSSTCVDKINPNTGVSDCPNRTAYCSNAAYLSLMKDQCPKTCGFC